MKDAFVASDAQKVKSEASTTSQAVAAVDMKLLSGAAHNDWMSYLTPIQTSLKEIETQQISKYSAKPLARCQKIFIKALKRSV